MAAQSWLRNFGLPIGISVAAVLGFWLSNELAVLLIGTTLIFSLFGRKSGLIAVTLYVAAAGIVMLIANNAAASDADAYIRLGLFLAAAMIIGLVVGNARTARASEQSFRSTLNNVPGMIATADAVGNHNYGNKKNLDYLGVTEDDIAGWKFIDFIHPEEREATAAAWSNSLETSQPMDILHRLRRFDGEYRWHHARVDPTFDEQGEVVRWCGLITDVDDLIKAEKRIRRAERELQTTLDTIPALVVSSWPEGKIDFMNAHWRERGFANEDLLSAREDLGNPTLKLIHPDDRTRFREAWLRSVMTGEPYQIEMRLRRSDGEYRWYLSRTVTLRDEEGAVVKRYSTAIDIDDRKKAEEALAARERELQHIVDAVPAPIWVVTADGEPTYISKKLVEWYGLDVDDLERVEGSKVRGAIRARVHPDDASAVEANMIHAFKTGQPFAMRYRHLRHDGLSRWVHGRVEPSRDENGGILNWYGVAIDIDDEKRAQDALLAAQDKLSRAAQLATLAELSASIAHEVNQPLAAVITNSHACLQWLSSSPPNVERARLAAHRIVRDANAAAGVISRTRELFTQSALSRTPTDLNEVIDEAHELLADKILAGGISFKRNLDRTIPSTMADRLQIQQVLVNLLRNGIEALQSVADAPKSLAVRSRQEGPETIVIEVRDSGAGINGSAAIFEPFVTTKKGGMGVGLAISRSIVESHGGRLWAESIKPRGTAFLFSLPVQP
jgi:PAS domain S-box-containing protein